MKIAGLDLSSLDVNTLSAHELDTIYNAFVKNIQVGYGPIDRQLPDQLLHDLRRYIKMHLLTGTRLFSGLNENKPAPQPDLNMAMCIYMLPTDSKDPTIQKYMQILEALGCSAAIKTLRAQAFQIARITEIAKLIEKEQEQLNITGFWEKSVNDLFDIVSEQLLVAAFEKLQMIDKEFSHSPVAIATKVVYFIEILDYINKRRHDNDFRILMDLYGFDEKSLRTFSKQVLYLLRAALFELQSMPNQPYLSTKDSCGMLLFRAAKMAQHGAITKAAQEQKKVAPEF